MADPTPDGLREAKSALEIARYDLAARDKRIAELERELGRVSLVLANYKERMNAHVPREQLEDAEERIVSTKRRNDYIHERLVTVSDDDVQVHATPEMSGVRSNGVEGERIAVSAKDEFPSGRIIWTKNGMPLDGFKPASLNECIVLGCPQPVARGSSGCCAEHVRALEGCKA